MGEMADDLIDQILDRTLDDTDDEDDGRPGERCKFCGTDLVFWRETDTGWRLFEIYGQQFKPHRCHRGLTPAKIVSNFDDLT